MALYSSCNYYGTETCPHGLSPSLGTCKGCNLYEGPARGVGDVVHTALKPVARVLRMTGCGGCQKRREALNKLLPLDLGDKKG